MPVVSIKIRDVTYPIACDEGQETNLLQIAVRLDKRVRALATNLGKAQDIQLLIMTALMMEDEINELKRMMSEGSTVERHPDNSIADTLDAIADYIENLANNLEKS